MQLQSGQMERFRSSWAEHTCAANAKRLREEKHIKKIIVNEFREQNLTSAAEAGYSTRSHVAPANPSTQFTQFDLSQREVGC